MSIIEQLENSSKEIIVLAENLFINHSKILYFPQPHTGIYDLSYQSYRWQDLSNEGKQLQSKLYDKYNKFQEIISYLLQKQIPKTKQSFQKYNEFILGYIDYSKRLNGGNTTTLINKEVKQNIENMMNLIKCIYDNHNTKIILVPDTNALLNNNILSKWEFEEFNKFELLLIPTVLTELDKLKNDRSKQTRSDNVNSVIRQIKEFRRRGKLTEGVTVISNKICLKSIAIEPDFKNTLSWLDINNQDDRIVASFLEVIRNYPNSDVRLVTSDINLQNKMEFAELPFIEPPEKEQ